MTTLSSEFLAQSTIPFRPFMGKLMSVITDTAGSRWMLATAEHARATTHVSWESARFQKAAALLTSQFILRIHLENPPSINV